MNKLLLFSKTSLWLRKLVAATLIPLAISSCTGIGEKVVSEESVFRPVHFKNLNGWSGADHRGAVQALLKSCPIAERNGVQGFGDASTWRNICTQALTRKLGDSEDARQFFEEHFFPAAVVGRDGPDGLFTGYYEPELNGARNETIKFKFPLHVRPPDLVTVNLGNFRENMKGEKIAGRVVKGSLIPYHNRAKIEQGALKNRNLELFWLDSATDAFFLHIQGSGRIRLRDGTVVRVGYADTNGHRYTAIGRELISRGFVPSNKMSMQAIRAWLKENPTEGVRLMRTNASYVFFRKLDGDGPLGAQGVALTPERSLAVDHRLMPLGLPVWIDTTTPDGARFRRLMIAQDTGSAIRGAVRGDVFWGPGARAANRAGKMKAPGRYWFLIPHTARPG